MDIRIDTPQETRPGQVIPVWKVIFPSGERRIETRMILSDRDEAEAIAKKKFGWYGSTGHTTKTHAVMGQDGFWYIGGQKHVPSTAREEAWAKLTERDKKILGLTD